MTMPGGEAGNSTICACSPDQCGDRKSCVTYTKCFRLWSTESGAPLTSDQSRLVERMGCSFGTADDDVGAMMQCNLDQEVLSMSGSRISCCSGENFCNSGLTMPNIDETRLRAAAGQQGLTYVQLLYVLLPIALLLTVVCAVVAVVYRQRRNKRAQNDKFKSLTGRKLHDYGIDLTETTSAENSVSSGSGSGVPLLVQRTVARQTTILENIGSGRYGQVYRADYRGSFVAVKVFSSREESAWRREQLIYQTTLLRHDGILAFLAADVTHAQSTTQLWLLTQYHAPGSLYNVLSESCVTRDQLLTYCYTAAAGLEHLHTEIHGTVMKPAIAHCDVKSKNVLVKLDGTCCIADLGMALLATENLSEGRLGTRRYAAPELLDQTCDVTDISSYLRADVYAFSLVMWEVIWRCTVNGKTREFSPPYWGTVVSEPSVADMKKVVCSGERPPVCNTWNSDQVLNSFSRLMQEGWSQTPSARPSMLRVKKELKSLLETNYREKDMKHVPFPTIDIVHV